MRLFGGLGGVTGGRREDAEEIPVRSTVGLDLVGKKQQYSRKVTCLSHQVFALQAVVESQKYFLEPEEVSVHHCFSCILSDEMDRMNVRTET